MLNFKKKIKEKEDKEQRKEYNKKYNKEYIKKRIAILLALAVILIPFAITISRFVINKVNDFYTRSKEFYFSSDKLGVDSPVFYVNNWSGVDDYVITINMNSRANNILATSYDIAYDITYTCSDNAICNLDKNQSIIYASTNSDFFNLTVTPNGQLDTNDKVAIEITATSKTAYTKTLKGKFNLVVGKENLSYQITDSPNSPYLELNITNTLPYYIVQEAFDSYSVGDKINIDTYLALPDQNKSKCYSSIITLNFDPNIVVLDLTDSNFLKATNIQTRLINSYNYVSGVTFKVDAISSSRVRFYKKDVSKNYTYPGSGGSCVIDLTSI